MVFSEKEITKLYRIHRTVLEMLRDRNYLVLDSEVDMSIEEFRAKFSESTTRVDLTIMKTNKDDPSDHIYVFFHDDIKLSVKAVATYRNRLITENVNRCIIVLQNQPKARARSDLTNLSSKVRIEDFLEEELLVNITKHVLVPKHQVLTNTEKKELLQTYTVKDTQLPKMLVTDPVARYFGLKRGQVVRIIRPSETAGTYVTYRIVV